ncbi:hypothetical protein [Flavobacterium sp. UBA4197]|uniref:hypothetical protein n=1 Tax=Flavobacterium sp. UBA4197 TaxID=1946546 RepID=UPI00257DA4FF|nr:hypothetical protein [Flavobacterium sp. UBA4197]
MAKLERLEIIVRKYKVWRKANPDRHILHCAMQENLSSAIMVAAGAVDVYGKIHNHQRRVGRSVLNEFGVILSHAEAEFSKAQSFDEIFAIVSKYRFRKIGKLTVYDTSIRIGEYLKFYPTKVYLHAGTDVGARYIFGPLKGRNLIEVDEFPPVIRNLNLTPGEIEDILCIYKDELKHLKFGIYILECTNLL